MPEETELEETSVTEEETEVSEHITLPIGIEVNGQRYKELVIDEMGGVDEQLAADKKKTGGNGSKAMTLVLCRAIQSIEGVLDQKRNPESLIDRKYVRGMYQVDRDFIVSRLQMLAGKDETTMSGKCQHCEDVFEEEVLLSKLPVTHWPDDKPCTLEFTLPRGYLEVAKGERIFHREGVIRFPNGSDQEAVAPIARNNRGKAMTAMLAATVLKLGALDHIDQDVTEKLKSRDRSHLFDVIKRGMPGLQQWKTVQCLGCDRDLDIMVDMSRFFG